MKKIEEYVRSIPDFPEPGIIFLDITSVLNDAEGLQLAIDSMDDLLKGVDFDVVVGTESRGFIFGAPIAYNLHKPFALIRKKGKLPCETVSQEYSLEYDKNPIEAIKSRVKSPESLAKKIRRKNIPMSLTSIEENIKDIAGVRVICSFPDDIYELEESFLKQDDIVLIERKDYIKNPKPSGYRSLHLIVQVPMPFRVRSLTTACRRYVTSCLTELPAFCFFADFYKLLILSFLTYQFFMCTTFSDLAIRYNQDLVCLLDRGKAVCDGDDGFPSGKFCYGILDQMFIFRVNTCGRLIQKFPVFIC